MHLTDFQMKRAAVVIGIDRTGGMTPLNAAALCAQRVETWLKGEGYDVICLTDKSGDVSLEMVKDALKSFVTVPASYDQLLVYFTGHGQYHTYSDFWLLSDAPGDPDEAINLEKAMHLARRCGIANVAFISDACRTLPTGDAQSKVTGSAGFPNVTGVPGTAKVDFFKATAEGTSAWEGKIDGDYWSVLTKAWMAAYEKPTPDMVTQVYAPTGLVDVVPNRRLEDFLVKEVNRLLYKLKLYTSPQDLELNVASADDHYIATCTPPPPGAAPVPIDPAMIDGAPDPSLAAMSVTSDATASIARHLSYRGLTPGGSLDPFSVHRFDTELGVEARLPSPAVKGFETACGFSLSGANIADVQLSDGAFDPVEKRGDDGSVEALRIYNQTEAACEVFMEFTNGRGTVLPAFQGYVGHINFTESGISSVSYVPAALDSRYSAYMEKRDALDRLRALAALSSAGNSFRLYGGPEAFDLLDAITFGASVDPSLSLYAAHAFLEKDEIDLLNQLISRVHSDLGVYLFDHILLSEAPADVVLPAYPMLTRNWNLLDVSPSPKPPAYQTVGRHLCPSLWTTFEPDGVAIVKTNFK